MFQTTDYIWIDTLWKLILFASFGFKKYCLYWKYSMVCLWCLSTSKHAIIFIFGLTQTFWATLNLIKILVFNKQLFHTTSSKRKFSLTTSKFLFTVLENRRVDYLKHFQGASEIRSPNFINIIPRSVSSYNIFILLIIVFQKDGVNVLMMKTTVR